ncbi:hypothetical protein F383_32150 [Gossypium arboreum]|uniref:Uncharacterized protein n=1 Tax=Gossypium arboreum TaxID=29729 RepID=A0A0B0MVJ2_GOSAR|nr:hypothetical protein F383_32150 [Gossypium arboreum]
MNILTFTTILAKISQLTCQGTKSTNSYYKPIHLANHNNTFNKMTKSLYMPYFQNTKIINTQNEILIV